MAMLARLVGMNAAGQEECLVDGRWVRVSQSAAPEGGFVAICSDVTEIRSQGERLTATNLRLDAALENMSQGLCLYDAGRRLQVVNLSNPAKSGDNLVTGTPAGGPTGQVRSGALEESGADATRSMVQMIDSQRTYESGQKAIQTIDETLAKSVATVGTVTGG